MPMVVLTGGEPTLQVDEAFVDLLHEKGFYVAMESNGLLPAPANLDWLTVSPKGERGKAPLGAAKKAEAKMADEIKIVFDGTSDPESVLENFLQHNTCDAPFLYLQPCDTGDPVRNHVITARCVNYIKQHPQWQLSLQTHKLIGIE